MGKTKSDYQEELKALGGEPGDKKVEELKEAIAAAEADQQDDQQQEPKEEQAPDQKETTQEESASQAEAGTSKKGASEATVLEVRRLRKENAQLKSELEALKKEYNSKGDYATIKANLEKSQKTITDLRNQISEQKSAEKSA